MSAGGGFGSGFGFIFGCFAGICALVLLLFAGCVALSIAGLVVAEFSPSDPVTLEDMP